MTRALWDPTFQCPQCAWLDPVNAPNGVPRFLQRVKWFIHRAYPRTPLNHRVRIWGAEGCERGGGAGGGMGVFGLMNVTLSVRCSPGSRRNSTVYHAFKMYRNYDGKGLLWYVGCAHGAATGRRLRPTLPSTAPGGSAQNWLRNLTPDTRRVSVDLIDFAPASAIAVYQIRRLQPEGHPPASELTACQLGVAGYPGHSLTML